MSEPLSTVPPDVVAPHTGSNGPAEESNGLPRLNPAQRAARRRAQQELFEAHPGRYVAYLDVWTGDSLERRVLVAADTLAECHRLMGALSPDILDRVTVTHAPAEAFDVPTSEIN